MSKPRILIVMTHVRYVRNYLESGALAELEKDCEIYFTVRNGITVEQSWLDRFPNFSFYDLPSEREQTAQLIFDVQTLRFAKKCASFAFREKVVFPTLSQRLKAGWSPRKIVRRALYRGLLGVLSSPVTYPLFRKGFVDRMPAAAGLAERVNAIRPDLVILPSSGYAIEATDIVRICRPLKIPTLLLIDNWDNLSSKSMLWELTDHVGVWGEQSKEHAVDIQGFAPDAVSLLGTPRFNSYFELRERTLPSHFPFPYALFVGTALAFDEASALRLLDQELEQHPELYGGLKVVYRPHPWRLGKDSIIGMDLKHVVLDPQMAANYAKGKLTKTFQPGLEYYPALLSNAAFVVGGITSMLIESAIFAKRFLVIVYDEDGNIQSPKLLYENYVHFRGLERLPGLTFCRELSDLTPLFRRMFEESRQPLTFTEVDRERQYFLFSDERTYAERLSGVVRGLLQRSPTVPHQAAASE
jgi:hypothetical protein